MNHTHECPLCGEGTLQPRTYGRDMEHKGVMLSVEGLQYDYCPVCESETTSPAQMDHNAALIRAAFVAARARVKAEQGLLTGAEIRCVRETLGITQKQAAKIFGGGPIAFAKYEAEDVVQSAAMDKLLRVSNAVPAAAEWLAERAGETLRRAVEVMTSHEAAAPVISAWNNSASPSANAPAKISDLSSLFRRGMEEYMEMASSAFTFPETSVTCSNDERFADAA